MSVKYDHQAIIKLYQNGRSQNQIAKDLGTRQPIISKILRTHKIQPRPCRRYEVANIFEKWTESSAYCFGFLLADGHLAKKEVAKRGSRYKLIINLSGKDAGHLRTIADLFGEKLPVKITNKTRNLSGTPKEYVNARLQIHSVSIAQSLIKLEFDSFKTGNHSALTVVPDDLWCHCLRGYFDGDGGFYLPHGSVAYFTGDIAPLNYICNKLNNLLGIGGFIKKRDNIFSLRYSGKHQVAKIADYLYNKSTIDLPRKSQLAKICLENI